MNHTVQLAFSSLVTAASAALMFLTGIIPIGTFAIPAFAGILLLPVMIELGAGWAFLNCTPKVRQYDILK